MRWLLAFFLIVSCFSFADTCGVNEFKSQVTGICCQLCPAGQYRIKDCGQDYSTSACQPCPTNHFTSIPNNFTSCEKCASVKCDSASGRILKQCTPTSDSRCDCPDNKYFNSDTLRCKECTKCNLGEKVTSRCKTDEDTKCGKCSEGTYSKNNTCLLCSHCHRGEVVVSECTIMKDTVCGTSVTISSPHSPNVNTPEPSSTTTRTTRSRSWIEKDDASKEPHSCEPQTFSDGVAWFLLALVGLLFFIIFLLAWPKLKKFLSKHKTPTPTPTLTQTTGKVTTIARPKSSEVAPIIENNTKFSSLPASVTEDLATHLNAKQGKNWKYLAGLMGYSSSFTQNLDLTPTEATQKLLQDWEHRSGATVFALYCLLQKLERDDALAVLFPFLATPKSSGEEVV